MQKIAQEVLGRTRDPQALSATLGTEMLNLKTSLDRAKLPESTAREFFEELADELLCVCGRELNDELRKVIRERAKQYLGSDDVAFLNALKGDVANLVGTDPRVHEADLDGRIERLLEAIRTEDDARTLHSTLEADAVANDPALQEAKNEIERLEEDLRRLDEWRRKYDNPDDSLNDENTYGIKVLERRLEDAERMLAEITQTVNLRKKRGVINRILENAGEKARAGISKEISADTNRRIAEVMPDNAIRVQCVERCLILEGQEGGSAGETLSVAYAFLATLFNRVEHQLPFVVDSPANPIDLRVRAKVAELIPKLTSQFVAFTISSERQGFITPLEAASKAPIQYLTLFRKGSTELEAAAKRQRDTVLTRDGVIVSGKEFFLSFHIDKEENQNAVSTS